VVLTAVGVVAVLVGGLAVHAAAGPSGATGLRTATVGTDDVAQTLDLVGTVEPVTQAAVAFPVAGTVASVGVTAGQLVAAGDTLATLNGASLQAAIDAQQAAVDQANLVLTKARSGVSSGSGASGSGGSGGSSTGTGSGAAASLTGSRGTGSGGGSSSGSSSGSGSTGGRGSGSSVDMSQLGPAQESVITAQQGVDSQLAQEQQLLDDAARICAAAGQPTSGGGAPTTSTTTTGGQPGSGTTGGPSAVDPTAVQACQSALQNVLDAQRSVDQAATAVRNAGADYDQLLQQVAAQVVASAQSSAGSTSGSGSGSGSGGGSSLGGGAATAADLIKDQKAVDAAQAQLAVAQQAMAQAGIVSPIAGTVAAVGLVPGQTVTAGSTSATVVVVGSGGVEVTTTVGVDRIPDVKIGDAATVRPDGTNDAIAGKVVAVGAPTTSSTTGATSYPVTITVPNGGQGLRNGSIAAVSIVTKAASHALVVPTSAVHTTGTTHTVNVVSGSKVTSTPVQIGAMGTTWTEVRSGLKAGQRVVLADLQQPLPASATQVPTNTRGSTTGVGGVGGIRLGGGGIVIPGGATRRATGG
jgi:multidrug efflux pump subunit AcrA (membrane-fusion protein)